MVVLSTCARLVPQPRKFTPMWSEVVDMARANYPSPSGEPAGSLANDRISLPTLWATPNDSATADASSSPSPQVR
jgi:hypothetical protein